MRRSTSGSTVLMGRGTVIFSQARGSSLGNGGKRKRKEVLSQTGLALNSVQRRPMTAVSLVTLKQIPLFPGKGRAARPLWMFWWKERPDTLVYENCQT